MNFRKNITLLVSVCACACSCMGQITQSNLRAYLAEEKFNDDPDSMIRSVYKLTDYHPVWLNKGNEPNINTLLHLIQNARDAGLEEGDYDIAAIVDIAKRNDRASSEANDLPSEIRLTRVALKFFKEIAYGKTRPAFGYDGLGYEPRCVDLPNLLSYHLVRQNLASLPEKLTDDSPEITAILNKIRKLNVVMSNKQFREVIITSDKVQLTNRPLVIKLTQLGILDTVNEKLNEKSLKNALIESQRQFDLIHDGIIRKSLLAALNVPVSDRLQQLKESLGYYRWLRCITSNEKVIVVNIPSAYMKVYENRRPVLEMKMVLGKPSTPTPALTSRIREVILYPYWHVPFSIATRELLPQIKRDVGFLTKSNYQVLDKQGNILNPRSIRWSRYNRNYFPYIIRQSTGCDNSLGLLKLNFPSPYSVYLHDTPFKEAFGMNKRFFSHGCMRMEKPMELGHLVLRKNPIAIDTIEQKGCIRNQSPVIVPADEHIPVIVWYNLAGADNTGRVHFYEDVYRKFRRKSPVE